MAIDVSKLSPDEVQYIIGQMKERGLIKAPSASKVTLNENGLFTLVVPGTGYTGMNLTVDGLDALEKNIAKIKTFVHANAKTAEAKNVIYKREKPEGKYATWPEETKKRFRKTVAAIELV